jgi:NAD(P)-dependent dehydrogenase (short-subunit alcohol dehydrogenase family)
MAAFSREKQVDLRALELDVQSQESVDAAVEKVIAEQGRIDVLIHNAGHMVFGPAEAFTPEQYAEIYDVNVLSTQRVNRAVLPHMRRRMQGLLVRVSSSSSAGGTPPYLAPYFAARAAMDAIAVQYARESHAGASRLRLSCPAPSPPAPTTSRMRVDRPMPGGAKWVRTMALASRSRRRLQPSSRPMLTPAPSPRRS